MRVKKFCVQIVVTVYAVNVSVIPDKIRAKLYLENIVNATLSLVLEISTVWVAVEFIKGFVVMENVIARYFYFITVKPVYNSQVGAAKSVR